MLDYLSGRIRRKEDEAELEEIFNLAARNLGRGGGKHLDEAINIAARLLHMDEWAQIAPPGVTLPLQVARTQDLN